MILNTILWGRSQEKKKAEIFLKNESREKEEEREKGGKLEEGKKNLLKNLQVLHGMWNNKSKVTWLAESPEWICGLSDIKTYSVSHYRHTAEPRGRDHGLPCAFWAHSNTHFPVPLQWDIMSTSSCQWNMFSLHHLSMNTFLTKSSLFPSGKSELRVQCHTREQRHTAEGVWGCPGDTCLKSFSDGQEVNFYAWSH